MPTDYELTGKLYKPLEAYTKSYRHPKQDTWYYFAESVQFKTCKSFKKYLEQKFPTAKFKVHKAKPLQIARTPHENNTKRNTET